MLGRDAKEGCTQSARGVPSAWARDIPARSPGGVLVTRSRSSVSDLARKPGLHPEVQCCSSQQPKRGQGATGMACEPRAVAWSGLPSRREQRWPAAGGGDLELWKRHN